MGDFHRRVQRMYERAKNDDKRDEVTAFKAACLTSMAIAAEADDEIQGLRKDAERYRFLRDRDLETVTEGGVFAGMTPDNVVLNGEDLDRAVDNRMEQ